MLLTAAPLCDWFFPFHNALAYPFIQLSSCLQCLFAFESAGIDAFPAGWLWLLCHRVVVPQLKCMLVTIKIHARDVYIYNFDLRLGLGPVPKPITFLNVEDLHCRHSFH